MMQCMHFRNNQDRKETLAIDTSAHDLSYRLLPQVKCFPALRRRQGDFFRVASFTYFRAFLVMLATCYVFSLIVLIGLLHHSQLR